ncbi:MAG: DUF4349 domain-containing protein [bacterium]
MNIKKKLTTYAETLSPTKDQQERIFIKTFGRLPDNNISSINKMKNYILAHKYITKGIFVGGILMFIALPLIVLNLGKVTKEQNVYSDSYQTSLNYAPSTVSKTEDTSMGKSNPASLPATTEDTQTQEANRAKQQSARITLVSNNVKSDYQVISNTASEENGYIANTNFTSNNSARATVTMRIPSNRFQTALDKIRVLKLETVSEEISTIDEQNEITQSQSIISNNLQKIKDLEKKKDLEKDNDKKNIIDSEIQYLKSQNDSYQKNINNIKVSTDFSTITVNISERAKEAGLISQDWGNIATSAQFIIIFWIQVIMWISLPIILLIIVIVIIKRSKKNI